MIWNLLGGLDWSGLPLAVEIVGVADVEQLIRDLVTIRNFQQQSEE